MLQILLVFNMYYIEDLLLGELVTPWTIFCFVPTTFCALTTQLMKLEKPFFFSKTKTLDSVPACGHVKVNCNTFQYFNFSLTRVQMCVLHNMKRNQVDSDNLWEQEYGFISYGVKFCSDSVKLGSKCYEINDISG